jgi:hypothetical protein
MTKREWVKFLKTIPEHRRDRTPEQQKLYLKKLGEYIPGTVPTSVIDDALRRISEGKDNFDSW